MGQLSPLMGRFTKVEELVRALYAFIEENRVQQKLKEYENRFQEEAGCGARHGIQYRFTGW